MRHPTPARLHQEIAWLLGVGLDLGADATNVNPHVVQFFAVLATPHGLENLSMGQHLARVAREVRQQLAFLTHQRDLVAATPHRHQVCRFFSSMWGL